MTTYLFRILNISCMRTHILGFILLGIGSVILFEQAGIFPDDTLVGGGLIGLGIYMLRFDIINHSTCYRCGKTVSDKAKACQYCGARFKNR